MCDPAIKLNPDAVVEALFEVRFSAEEVPELALSKLASAPLFSGFSLQRLPSADIPAAIRSAEPNLAHQPTFEFKSEDGRRVARLGDRVFSWHSLPPYAGWPVFRQEIGSHFQFLLSNIKGFVAKRLGLKYINLLDYERHKISKVGDLELSINLYGRSLEAPMNLNYLLKETPLHNALIRISSPELISGLPRPISAFIDIDVFTPDEYRSNDFDATINWVEIAHQLVKREFFSLLPAAVVQQLKEKS